MMNIHRSSLLPGIARLSRKNIPANLSYRTLGYHQRFRSSYTQICCMHSETFLQGNTADYIDDLYTAWQKDPATVHASWQAYFGAIENGRPPPPIGLPPSEGLGLIRKARAMQTVNSRSTASQSQADNSQIRLQRLIRAFQASGHGKADINPLKVKTKNLPLPEDLRLDFYGFSKTDLDRRFALNPEKTPEFLRARSENPTLREIIAACETVYCGSIGAEYMHVATHEEREWIRKRIESPDRYCISQDEKKRILDRLVWTTQFEKFMATKFPNAKRFSIEGAESQVPALKAAIDLSAELGVRNIVFPCCHRGKLNMLSNVTDKPNELIFSEFSPGSESRHGIEGDVKYHLGMNNECETPSGKNVHVSILPNPSHLESQNPVGHGMARAIQQQNGGDRATTMVLNSHTDASLAGQGIIYETLGLSGLKAYETGGTMHFVVNNQVGFTTDPESARTSFYVSDIAKSVDAPIFHVNGDDVEAVVFASKLAAEYRSTFGKDCWVDMVCYRKLGHNEMDQPSFTQPLMYQEISEKQSILESYSSNLIQEGVVTQEDIDQIEANVWSKMSESLEKSKTPEALEREYLTSQWESLPKPADIIQKVFPARPTAINRDVVGTVASKLGIPDAPFTVHKSLHRILQKRQQSLYEGRDIDWATAEALAMGSLCLEGYHVRVSGQDVERGTFSQRHAVLHDQNTDEVYIPLNSLASQQAEFTISNSSLSEYGVMGFDYGYSCMHPNALVMWEAQFGDFANNAQCVIDQFVSSGENKWLLRSGLVLSLPHGFDGQGPEHSSARMERFLQLCGEDGLRFPSAEELERQHQDANMQVVYMTTPANLFHVLRRQLHRDYRKPLILLFSKSLLRHPMARSNIEDFTGQAGFQSLIPDPAQSAMEPSKIKRVIYCSGQVYMSLAKYREAHQITDTAITRVEELHPFPWQQVRDNLEQYSNIEDVVWCQEESLNDGPWAFARARMETIFDTIETHKGRRLRFAGRKATPSVATGFAKQHAAQEIALLREAFQHEQ